MADYAQVGLTLREQLLALLRSESRQRRFLSAAHVALRPLDGALEGAVAGFVWHLRWDGMGWGSRRMRGIGGQVSF